MGSQAPHAVSHEATTEAPLTRRQMAARKRAAAQKAINQATNKARRTNHPRPACRIERAIRAAKVNVAVINGLIAEHSSLNLAGHTLQSLLQINFGAGRDHGLPLNGFYWKDRAIGDAFDAVKQALGEPGRAFYFYA